MDMTRSTPLRRAAALLAVVLAAAACSGGGHGDHRVGGRPLAALPGGSGAARLVITTDNGLRLRPADGPAADVDRRVDRHWTHQGDTWVLDLSCPAHGDRADRCPRLPEVDVPAGTAVTVSARDAGIDAAGVSGALDLTTVNGDVTVTRSGRDGATVRLATRNGSVRATALDAGRLRAGTVNGDVDLDCATAPATVTAATTNGSVRVGVSHGAPAYRITARAANGRPSVTVPTASAAGGHRMSLTTVNGDVTATTG
ncbi:DUF4097 family beta strand repeat-containing protein [Streptomyces sp. NPDC001843]|uniref:DUF4097 family beta strand repeat-containing protein n=1 Tax=Streptomyces sp. NPDC001843 TaxID=3364617 RepID=UPI0036AC4CEA